MAENARPGNWNYTPFNCPGQYGDDTTYKLCIGWLSETCKTIHDWGAGMAYARRFVPEGVTYTAVDWAQSAGPWVDVIEHAADYHPDPAPDGILIRHVLEHNVRWTDVLDNAVATFRKRLALVIFTPFGPETRRLTDDWPIDWSFRKRDLTSRLKGLTVKQKHLATERIVYGEGEHVFLIERP